MSDLKHCYHCDDETKTVESDCIRCGLSKTNYVLDEISGEEVPKKCCENCKGYFCESSCESFGVNIIDDFPYDWNIKEDFCSRNSIFGVPIERGNKKSCRKCCENCKLFTYDRECALTGMFMDYAVDVGRKWNSKEDFCSRFELKESEK